MRIIDKNKDYYDFYQNIYIDNKFVFDRRNSYNLTKEEFASNFYHNESRHTWYSYNDDNVKFILLQICNTFWLFTLTITSTTNYGQCTDYNLELVHTWKDYSCNSELIKLSHIYFWYYAKKDINQIIKEAECKDYKVEKCFDKFHIYTRKGNKLIDSVKTIPILQNIGIASLIDPLTIYLEIENYFSMQESNKERTESKGLTDDEKIENHGFDIKTSFRGKA